MANDDDTLLAAYRVKLNQRHRLEMKRPVEGVLIVLLVVVV